ncbi:MAG: DUF5132 domain-containing protein [Pseudonocardiaceae bacterium]
MASPYKTALPYLIGFVTAPLVGMLIKPLVRGAIKTTIGIGLEVKKLAAEAAEDLQDIAAEAGAEFVAAETKSDVSATAFQDHLDGHVRH